VVLIINVLNGKLGVRAIIFYVMAVVVNFVGFVVGLTTFPYSMGSEFADYRILRAALGLEGVLWYLKREREILTIGGYSLSVWCWLGLVGGDEDML
jgi:hypothetical protein